MANIRFFYFCIHDFQYGKRFRFAPSFNNVFIHSIWPACIDFAMHLIIRLASMQGHRRRGGGLKERIEVQIDKLLLVPPPGFLDPPPPLMCRKIEVFSSLGLFSTSHPIAQLVECLTFFLWFGRLLDIFPLILANPGGEGSSNPAETMIFLPVIFNF